MLKKHKRILGMIGLASSLVATSPIAVMASDEPDLNRENELHQLYKNFNSAPTDISQWSTAKKGKVEQYEINKADNLWNVSEVLFGDPNFWPKIWSLNSEKIENPHQIFPNQTLKFTAGSLTAPPNLEIDKKAESSESNIEAEILADQTPIPEPGPNVVVAEEKPTAPESSQAEAEEANDLTAAETTEDQPAGEAKPEIDPKVQELMGLANLPIYENKSDAFRELPESLPKWSFGQRIPKLKVEVKRLDRMPPVPEENLRFFVSNDEFNFAGEFVGSEMGHLTAAEYQYIDLKLNEGISDRKFYAVTEKGKIKDPVTKEKATVYQVEGEVEATEVVNSKENIYRGLVQKLIVPIQIGAKLIPGSWPKFKVTTGELVSGKAWIIGGEFDIERRLIHQNSIVYLSGEGLSEGSTYPVYRKNPIRVDSSLEFENPRKIGAIKVIKVSQRFATGVLVKSTEEVYVGDVTDPSLISLE